MHVELTTSGGIAYFPGLRKPVIVESETLSSQDAAELGGLVEAAHFFALPANLAPGPARPDAQSYVLKIRDAEREHTVRLADPIAEPELAALVTFVRKHAPPRGG
jgi:hypothetical protein